MQDEDRTKLYRQVFGTPQGTLVLADLMTQFDGLGSPYGDDARETERRLGNKDVILHILDSLNVLYDYHLIAEALLDIPAPQPIPKQEETDS